MKATKLILCTILLIFIGCQSELEEKNSNVSAQSVGLKFINDYMKNVENLDFVEWIEQYPLTTKSFKLEIKRLVDEAEKEAPGYGLGFDPILDAQDYPNKGFQLKSIDTISGFMRVAGKDWKDFELTIKLIQKDNKWMIDGCGIINIPLDKQAPRN